MHMKEQGIRAAAAAALGALCAYGVQMFVPLVVLVAATCSFFFQAEDGIRDT